MAKKNMLLLRGFCIVITLGLLSLFGQAAQDNSDILSSLAEDEVAIELFWHEEKMAVKGQEKILELGDVKKTDIKGKKPSCTAKCRKGVKILAKNENENGLFVIDGIITEKTTEYVIFKGKLEFISKDKKRRREITVISQKLIKGKEHMLGGMKETSGKTEVISMKASW